MHISLTETLKDYIKQKVSSGLYNNASEVVREALRLMYKDEATSQFQLDRLRLEVAIGAKQAERGEFVSQSMRAIFDETEQEKNGQL